MSGCLDVLGLREDDVTKFLSCQTHIGEKRVDFQMEQYVFKRRNDGTPIFNLRKTWEKLLLAARAIAAIENPADVCVISARNEGQRAILKFAHYTGATPIAGRFTPGTFTNQIQAAFREPRLLVITDPITDHQPVREAAYVNVPVVAFCNTSSPLRYIDIAIPCNNGASHSVGLMWWLLAREVLRLRGAISRDMPWDVMVDLFFYRNPEEAEKQEAEVVKTVKEQPEYVPEEPFIRTEVTDWATESSLLPAAAAAPPPSVQPGYPAAEDWSATDTGDWGATPAPAVTSEWGGTAADNWD